MNKFGKKNWMSLLLFGLIGQIAWSVENMYFNMFVFYEVSPNLDTVTLMVQLSGIVATVTTLIAGTVSDKIGNRKAFICYGYIIWGITVAIFGSLSPDKIGTLFGLKVEQAIPLCLVLVVVGDCVMTVFGSSANDASFNAWVTDNTKSDFRGKVESVLSVLPLVAMLIVAGGFGILVGFIGYFGLFLALGIVISICGVVGLFVIEDSKTLEKKGSLKDIFYGFKPSVIKNNVPFYIVLCISCIYGIACQIFMPYLIIYMRTYLGFGEIEYSLVFGAAIILGAIVNLIVGPLSDKVDKTKLMYAGAGVMAVGLFMMFLFKDMDKIALLVLFGLAGFIMITGYIFFSAMCGAVTRDYTPQQDAGKLQGVRMLFNVLIPMLVGPMIGNAINKINAIPLKDAGADAMTTAYVPAPDIFWVASICVLFTFILIPILSKVVKKYNKA